MYPFLDSRKVVAARGTPEAVHTVALHGGSGRLGPLPWSPTPARKPQLMGLQLIQKAADCQKQRLVLGESQA